VVRSVHGISGRILAPWLKIATRGRLKNEVAGRNVRTFRLSYTSDATSHTWSSKKKPKTNAGNQEGLGGLTGLHRYVILPIMMSLLFPLPKGVFIPNGHEEVIPQIFSWEFCGLQVTCGLWDLARFHCQSYLLLFFF